MFDHVGLKVRDLSACVRFYTAALAPLGLEAGPGCETSAGFGPPGAPALWLAVGTPGSGAHVALTSPSRSAVIAFHAAGLKAGGRDNGAPGPRTDYGPHYFAAFLIDPDGNNIEAVYTGEG